MKLYPYQEAALTAAQQLRHPALFMEMRLGKTVVAIKLLKQRKARRVLVLCPLSVVPVWMDHCKEEGLPVVNLRKEKKKETKPRGWHVVNYEFMLRHKELAEEWWDAVVLDESTKIRNPKTKISKLCTKGFDGVRWRVILSGCPAPENPLEYTPQFLFLNREFLGCNNYWSVRSNYFTPTGYGGYDWQPGYGTAKHIREYVRKHAVVLKRRDVNVGGVKEYRCRYVEPSKRQVELTEEMVSQWSVDGTFTQWAVVMHTWMARVAGGFHPQEKAEVVSKNKAAELVELMCGELSGEKAVVFFRFNAELHLCHDMLKKAGIDSIRIHGGVKPEAREELRRAFSESQGPQVALLQLKCARMGLDFSAADTAIYYSNGFSLEDRIQSEDRIIHPAKKTPLLLLDLITRDSLDEDVTQALRMKNLRSQTFLPSVFEAWKNRVMEGRKA